MTKSGTATHLKPPPGRDLPRKSARLGATVRSIVLTPDEAMAAAVAAPERATTFVLAALGGAGLMSWWLKFAGLIGLRNASADGFEWALLGSALVAGAILGVLALVVWSAVMPFAVRALGGAITARELRIVWGMSSFPLVVALVPLAAIDLLVVGPQSFTTDRLGNALETAWLAVSIAVASSLVAWWLVLMVRGVKTAASLDIAKATVTLAAAVVALGLAVAAIRGVLVLGERVSG